MISKLKQLRIEKCISQQQLADVILVSQQSVNKYENHNVEPEISTMIRIADYFNVSLDYLVGRTEIREIVTKEKMSDLSDSEVKIIKGFRKLKNKQKECIFSIIESYLWFFELIKILNY